MKRVCLICLVTLLLVSVIPMGCGTTVTTPEVAWSKTFGGSDYEDGYSAQQTSDGGYMIAGYTDSYGVGGWDIWLIKADSSGNLAWNKTFGGSGTDVALSIQQTPDGGYIITGVTDSYGAGGSDVWLIEVNA